jgi:hypothetical protein
MLHHVVITLMMEAVSAFEMSVSFYEAVWLSTPENSPSSFK